MKRILFFLSLLPYLASAQVAKDTVTVLTSAQITAASPNDTANIYFVIANAWRKANFDSIARYSRNRFQTLTLDSTHIAANGLNLQGTRFTGVLPVSRGGTGLTTLTAANRIPYANSAATALTTSAGLTFDGTNFATTGTASATKFIPTGGSATGNGMYLPGSNRLAFSTNGVERVRIDNAGNVGIGTIPSAWRDIFTAFQFGLTGSFYALSSNDEEMNFASNYYQDLNGDERRIINGYAERLRLKNGRFEFDNAGVGLSNSIISWNVRLVIDSTGNVGIGVASPASKLEVNGTSAFANGSAGAPSMTNTGNTDTGMWFPAADVVGFSTNGVERMRVKANGQVRFIPLAADPGGAENGDVYYNSATNKLRVYANGTWVDLH